MSERDRQFRDFYATLRIRDQLTYYRNRCDEYGRAHRQVVVVRTTLLLLAAAAGVVGQFADGTGRAAWAVVAAVLASLAGAVTAYEALIGFPQLEKLFADAAHNLEEAEIDWDEAAGGAAEDREIDRVEQIFRSEIGQWGQLVVKSAPSAEPPAERPADGGAPPPDGPAPG